MKDVKLTFCENIHLLRMKHHLTQAEMAKLLSISVRTICLLENGIIPPRLSVSILYNIYAVFHIRPADMLSPLSLTDLEN